MKLMKVYLGERSKFAVVRALLVPCDVIDFTVFSHSVAGTRFSVRRHVTSK